MKHLLIILLVVFYSTDIVFSQTFEETKQRAEQGNAKAQYELGLMYLAGDSVLMNPLSAFKWIKQSAEQRFPSALLKTGLLYYNGIGINTDKDSAFYWINKYSKHINDTGKIQLFHLFKKWSTETGDARVQYNLGLMFYKGEGTAMNKNKANDYFLKSAQDGLPRILAKLGFPISNLDISFDWLEQYANEDEPCAQFTFGVILFNSIVYADIGEIVWDEKVTEDGVITEKEYNSFTAQADKLRNKLAKQATYWISKAYENGYEEAKDVWEENELWKYEE